MTVTTKEALETLAEDELYALVLHCVKMRNEHGASYAIKFSFRVPRKDVDPAIWRAGMTEHFMRAAGRAQELIFAALDILRNMNRDA